MGSRKHECLGDSVTIPHDTQYCDRCQTDFRYHHHRLPDVGYRIPVISKTTTKLAKPSPSHQGVVEDMAVVRAALALGQLSGSQISPPPLHDTLEPQDLDKEPNSRPDLRDQQLIQRQNHTANITPPRLSHSGLSRLPIPSNEVGNGRILSDFDETFGREGKDGA